MKQMVVVVVVVDVFGKGDWLVIIVIVVGDDGCGSVSAGGRG